MMALYFLHYNFYRVHDTLRATPAMEAGVAPKLWDESDIVGLIDKATPAPEPRWPYNTAKKRQQEIERENDLRELIQWLIDTAEQEAA